MRDEESSDDGLGSSRCGVAATLRLTPSGICTYASPDVRKVYGYEPDAIVGRAILALAHPLEAHQLRRALSRFREDGSEQRTWHIVSRHADLYWTLTEVQAISVECAGDVTEFVCFVRRLEDLGQDELWTADGTPQPILAMYAATHDLREPAAVVNMCATLLRDRHAESLTDRDRALLDKTLRSTRAVFRRIEDVQAVAEMGRRLPAADLVELSQAAESAAVDLNLARPGGTSRVSIEQLPEVRGDGPWLTQLLRDTMEMVADTARSPSVDLRVGARRSDVWWRLSVSADRVAREPGSGEQDRWLVPRTVCRRIVECHGGEFVDNVDGARRARHISFTLPVIS
jgi:PAS domain S-box-containing protein